MTSVVAVVHRGDTRWVYLDAGVFTGLVETLDEAIRYRLETDATGPTGPCVLAGPTCDSADVLYEKQPVHLPLSLAEGDRVVLTSAGAYTTCYSTVGFNGFAPLPTELVRVTGPTRGTIASHAVAAVGMSLPWPLLVLLVWERAGDGWVLGLAGAARMLPYVVLSWAAGRLADRYARDRIVRLTLAARLVLLFGVAAALTIGQTWLALVAATLAIAVATPAYPALAAAMPGLAGRHTERATGLLVTCEVASFVVGPALGGLLLAPATRPLVPWVAVVCLVAAWVLFDGVRLPKPAAAVATTRANGVLAALRTSAVLRGAVAAVAVVNAVAASRRSGAAPARRGLGRRERGHGVRDRDRGAGASGPWAGRCSDGSRPAGASARGSGWSCSAAAWSAWRRRLRCGSPCRCSTLAGAAAVQVEIVATAYVQRAAPDRLRASVLGLTDTAMVAAALLGALVAPALAASDRRAGRSCSSPRREAWPRWSLVRRPVEGMATVEEPQSIAA